MKLLHNETKLKIQNHLIFVIGLPIYVVILVCGCAIHKPNVEITGYLEKGSSNSQVYNRLTEQRQNLDSTIFVDVANDLIEKIEVYDENTGYASIFVQPDKKITLHTPKGTATNAAYSLTPKGAYELLINPNPLLEGLLKDAKITFSQGLGPPVVTIPSCIFDKIGRGSGRLWVETLVYRWQLSEYVAIQATQNNDPGAGDLWVDAFHALQTACSEFDSFFSDCPQTIREEFRERYFGRPSRCEGIDY